MISVVKSPRPPLFERGETSLGRHFLQLPPFAKGDGGGFSCVGATNIQVMNVYEPINVPDSKIPEFLNSITSCRALRKALLAGCSKTLRYKAPEVPRSEPRSSLRDATSLSRARHGKG